MNFVKFFQNYQKKEETPNSINKNKVFFYCEKITVKGALWGKLEIEDKYVIFSSIDGQRPNEGIYKFGALPSFFRNR